MQKKILVLGLAVSLFTACESPEATDSSGGKNNAISFQTSITRAVDNQWETKDSVGVFQIPNEKDFSKALAKNTAYTTTEGDGKFTSKTPLYYPEGDTSNYDFIAYYPYKKGVLSTYSINVVNQGNQNKLDFLYGKTLKQGSSNTNINLQFKHQLTNLVVEIEAGKDVPSLEGLTVTLTNSPTQATFNLENEELSVVPNSTKDILLKTTVSQDKLSATSKAIIIPSSYNNNTLVFKQPNQGRFTYTLKEKEFLAGKQYKIVAKLSKEGTIHGEELDGIDTTIEDWYAERENTDNIDDNFGEKGSTVADGDGTEASPYSVAQLLQYTDNKPKNGSYVKGYMIAMTNHSGYVKYPPITEKEYKEFMSSTTGTEGQFLLSDSPNEKDISKLVVVRGAYQYIDQTVQYCLPYLTQQVQFTIDTKTQRFEWVEKYKKVSSGLCMIPVAYPLIFTK